MRALATLVAIASVFGSTVYAETPLERGSYLVNTIMTCKLTPPMGFPTMPR
jgi:hypothetical protein